MSVKEKESIKLNEQLTQQMDIILKCTISSEKYGRLLLASPPESRYPYVYPRDCNCAVQLFRRLAGSVVGYDVAGQAFDLMRSMAYFIKDVLSDSGYWGQRYGLDGCDKSIYKQEDNLAHGIAIICNYLLACHRLKKAIPELEELLYKIDQALVYAIERFYQKELNLFHSTTSIHESALEEGFTCWVNFAFLYAFSLAEEVANLLDEKNLISDSHLRFRKHFLYSVSELFLYGERYVRRIDPQGNIDMRPDFTLLSPFYFGFCHYGSALNKSVSFLEKQLWDPELGMIMRYLPFSKDFATHVHAGNGPWLQYTAILAQYHYWSGNLKRGDELLQLIDVHKNDQGEIPEHLSTCKRFEEFRKNEWQTGVDFQKEFHEPILLENVQFDKILEETNNMARAYGETGEKCMFVNAASPEGGYIQFATPLMWSHVEYARALLIRNGDWWKVNRQ